VFFQFQSREHGGFSQSLPSPLPPFNRPPTYRQPHENLAAEFRDLFLPLSLPDSLSSTFNFPFLTPEFRESNHSTSTPQRTFK
jgi:hypothetical protein